MERTARIAVAGRQTIIGAAVLRALAREGYTQLLGADRDEPDFTIAAEVEAWFVRTAPEYLFVAAGKSGGIEMNRAQPATLLRDNLLTAAHLIEGAHRHRVRKLLYLGSSCSYPKQCAQPMRVESLLTGPLEPTNEAYAIGKLAGLKMCEAYRRQHQAPFIVGIPGDAFGPGDDFDPSHSHVIAALIRRLHEAKGRRAPSVEIWGTGTPRRGFTYVEDLASACLFVMRAYDGPEPINMGSGWDVAIRDVAAMIQEVVGYQGTLRFDASKPDGMPVKVLDSSRLLALGWAPRWSMRSALEATYQWFLEVERQPTERGSDASCAVISREFR